MKDIEKIRSICPGWNFSDIAFIRCLEWDSNTLSIVFNSQSRSHKYQWPDYNENFLQIKIEFKGVRNLRLNFEGDSLQQVLGFNIVDISSNGWEDVKYKIEDYENGVIDFVCSNLIIDTAVKSIKVPF